MKNKNMKNKLKTPTCNITSHHITDTDADTNTEHVNCEFFFCCYFSFV